MVKEIERKFLLKILPDLTGLKPVRYERYFINNDGGRQVRVQRRGERFELETKSKLNELEFTKTKEEITENDFIRLSAQADKAIIRDSYLISEQPNITIKKYFGDYEGLIRAEIEYENLGQVNDCVLPEWFGSEITGTELGHDSELIKLSRHAFLDILKQYL